MCRSFKEKNKGFYVCNTEVTKEEFELIKNKK